VLYMIYSSLNRGVLYAAYSYRRKGNGILCTGLRREESSTLLADPNRDKS
jgi:hypothetical protein